MNVLWIEDFGGLQAGKNILNQMFGDLLSFDVWDNDLFSLKTRPSDLNEFCTQQKSLHTVYLCRNYFDYAEFKENHAILNKIDTVIIDVRLDNGEHVDLDKDIPESYTDKSKFHENGGFYVFNDLIHLGVPAERMCFMTGEKNSIDAFKKKCSEIYIPEVKAFEKKDIEYENLREWIKKQESDYIKLRRGVIKSCDFLKSYIEKDDHNIQFRDFIKKENSHEIATTDINNYLDTLAQFFPIKQPNDQAALNAQYRLFLRTLVHEWEENIEPNSLKEKYAGDLSKIRDIYTFAWLMKMTRNWVSHANLLEPLDHQTIAFLFLVNMRAMFKLPKANQPYEEILLSCISPSPADNLQNLDDDIKYAEECVDGILTGLNKNETGHFGNKINAIYKQNTGNTDAELHDFKKFLLQYFWINQKFNSRNLTSPSNDFLPTLARHIYNRSFS
ncbi:MAG: hypothetical protein Q8Q50_15165 [Methylobacter sp.]|nr:hypothetical protein [Methylobacter sp.]